MIFWTVLTKSDLFELKLPWGLIATPQEVETLEIRIEDEQVVSRTFTLTKRKPQIEKERKLVLGGPNWSKYLSHKSLDASESSTVSLFVDSNGKFDISSDRMTGITVVGAMRTPRKNMNTKTPTKTTITAPDPLALGLMLMGLPEANIDPSILAESPKLLPYGEDVPSGEDVPKLM